MHSESLSKISGPASTLGASSTIFSCRGVCIDLRLLRGHLCVDKGSTEEDSLVPMRCQPREFKRLYAGDVDFSVWSLKKINHTRNLRVT